ncbi:MAG TPA: protein-L-isoaspartate(D-aspartate) O-methyltransferase [Alphaproteobacteria bacterium]|nr:protein-L-isoaspartate(D-aspartate) O-methyltransferase [Alphaproteobacteria bacterium]
MTQKGDSVGYAAHGHDGARAALLAEIAEEAAATAIYTRRDAFSPEVMAAIGRVPRERFVEPGQEPLAYVNGPLPIGYGQTISQPYIVALMTDLLDLRSGHRVLEVGTGSGYQTAVLAELDAEVFSLEIVPELARRSANRLHALGYRRLQLRQGDGSRGWPEFAPYDRILVAAAASDIPQPLIDQLAPTGRMVIPEGPEPMGQMLTLVEKDSDGMIRGNPLLPVAFVPLMSTGSWRSHSFPEKRN